MANVCPVRDKTAVGPLACLFQSGNRVTIVARLSP
jgi:hypothetical protein